MADGSLAFTPAVQSATAPLWEKLSGHVTPLEWRLQAPLIEEINRLKREKHAVILAHNYMTPEIFHGVGDFVGDSLGLAREAARSDAKVIVQAGVHFMAETSKVLCPDKTVLIPDLHAGCSLAASITAADVRLIKQRYPGLPVILLPDEFLARNVARQTPIGIIAWRGRCEVHERFTAEDIAEMRAAWPDALVLAHPECPTEVIEASDFAGSTAAMSDFVIRRRPARVVLITECSMADNVACDAPETEFVRPCNLCPHMKRITLDNILEALRHDRYEVTVPEDVAMRARAAVQRMIDLPPPAVPARYDLVKARHHVDVELI